jgi:hypothetical protein
MLPTYEQFCIGHFLRYVAGDEWVSVFLDSRSFCFFQNLLNNFDMKDGTDMCANFALS